MDLLTETLCKAGLNHFSRRLGGRGLYPLSFVSAEPKGVEKEGGSVEREGAWGKVWFSGFPKKKKKKRGREGLKTNA